MKKKSRASLLAPYPPGGRFGRSEGRRPLRGTMIVRTKHRSRSLGFSLPHYVRSVEASFAPSLTV